MEKGMKTVEKRCTEGGGMMGRGWGGGGLNKVYMTQVERNGESARHRVTFTTKPKNGESQRKPASFLFLFVFSIRRKLFSTFKHLETDLFRQRKFFTKFI